MTKPKTTPGKKRKKRLGKRGLTLRALNARPQKAVENEIVFKIYWTIEDAHAALQSYKEIPQHRERRLYRVDLRALTETFWILAGDQYEMYRIVNSARLDAKFTAAYGVLLDGDPRPRLEDAISLMTIQIREQEALLEKMKAQPDPVPFFQKFIATVEIEIGMKHVILKSKIELLEQLKTTPRADLYYVYKGARERLHTKLTNYRSQALVEHPALSSTDIPDMSDPIGESDGFKIEEGTRSVGAETADDAQEEVLG